MAGSPDDAGPLPWAAHYEAHLLPELDRDVVRRPRRSSEEGGGGGEEGQPEHRPRRRSSRSSRGPAAVPLAGARDYHLFQGSGGGGGGGVDCVYTSAGRRLAELTRFVARPWSRGGGRGACDPPRISPGFPPGGARPRAEGSRGGGPEIPKWEPLRGMVFPIVQAGEPLNDCPNK